MNSSSAQIDKASCKTFLSAMSQIKQCEAQGGSRIEDQGSRIEVRGSRIEVRGSRIEVRGSRIED